MNFKLVFLKRYMLFTKIYRITCFCEDRLRQTPAAWFIREMREVEMSNVTELLFGINPFMLWVGNGCSDFFVFVFVFQEDCVSLLATYSSKWLVLRNLPRELNLGDLILISLALALVGYMSTIFNMRIIGKSKWGTHERYKVAVLLQYLTW